MTDKYKSYTNWVEFAAEVKGNWKGYVWMSDEQKPTIVSIEKPFDFTTVKTNPFVVEGLLYDEEKSLSVTIRHTGTYHIDCFNLKGFAKDDKVDFVKEKYLSHGFSTKQKLKFEQLWVSEPDDNCEGMEVLTMKALLFTGFTANNQQNK